MTPQSILSIPPPTVRKSPYFINGFVDFICIGGASIIVYLTLYLLGKDGESATAFSLSGALVAICNWPHFSATSYRLYSSKDTIRQYPMTAILIPILLGFALVGSFWYPTFIAPYFIKIFLLWSPYHYSGQSVGVTMLYARRAGFKVESWERQALVVFLFSTYLVPTFLSETGLQAAPYYGISLPGLGLPLWLPILFRWMMYGALVTFVASLGWRAFAKREIPPFALWIPPAAQFIWFIPGGMSPAFNTFVPLFHSLQYLMIAWAMQLKEKLDRDGIQPSPRYVWGETIRWGGINIAGGALLFYVFPLTASWVTGRTFAFATAAVISAVQVHHFFVDGVIWRLKRKSVASPLMMRLSDVMGDVGTGTRISGFIEQVPTS